MFFKLKESSSTILLYGGVGRSRGSVNLPVVVRHPVEGVNPPEAPHEARKGGISPQRGLIYDAG